MTENARDPGVLDPYAAGFAAWLSARGYAPSTVKKQLRLMGRLGQWLAGEHIPLSALDDDTAGRFACSVRSSGRARLSMRGVMPVLEYLRGAGAVPGGEFTPHQQWNPACSEKAWTHDVVADGTATLPRVPLNPDVFLRRVAEQWSACKGGRTYAGQRWHSLHQFVQKGGYAVALKARPARIDGH